MIPKEAIILAGGAGTRLKSVVKDIPKPMALVGEKPFLEYLFSYLENYGIEHVILSVGYNSKVISDHFKSQYGSMKISYAVENKPLGTGGGIRLALDKVKGDHTFILNGDTFFKVNLHDLSEFYFAHEADMSITVKRKRDFFRYGTVELDVCKVVAFREKRPMKSGLINGGVYITNKSILNDFKIGEKFSFETDFLEKSLDTLKLCAMRCSEYFIDIGVPLDYEKAKRELPQKATY
jgi:D-glycero-alpha-D-manno-heptose 1-phosphate guanylyltransferase